MVDYRKEIEKKKNTRLPDADILATEDNMRRVLQVVLSKVNDLENRIALLETKK